MGDKKLLSQLNVTKCHSLEYVPAHVFRDSHNDKAVSQGRMDLHGPCKEQPVISLAIS